MKKNFKPSPQNGILGLSLKLPKSSPRPFYMGFLPTPLLGGDYPVIQSELEAKHVAHRKHVRESHD